MLTLSAVLPGVAPVAFGTLDVCAGDIRHTGLACRPRQVTGAVNAGGVVASILAVGAVSAGSTRLASWSLFARRTLYTLYALVTGVAFVSFGSLGSRLALQAALALGSLVAGVTLDALRTAHADRLGVGQPAVIRPRHNALGIDGRREHIADVALVALISLGTLSAGRAGCALGTRRPLGSRRAGIALVAFFTLGTLWSRVALDAHWVGVLKPAVVSPAHHAVGGYAWREYGSHWPLRPLNKLRPAEIYGYSVRHYSTTSEVASATAAESIRCAPITFPPTNLTRVSSVTEPLAGNSNVSS